MSLLSFRERDTIGFGTSGLTDAEIDALARLEPLLPKGLLNWGHRSLTFGPFCGVLRVGDLTIELLPKTGSANHARGVLVAMLRATSTISAGPTRDAAIGKQRLHLLDQFIVEFCSRVEDALRQGAIAQYVQHDDNLRAVRGRLHVTQHLRSNFVDRTRLYCRFDERTLDNTYNRGLKFVLHRLRSAAVTSSTKGAVAALTHRFDQVQDTVVTPGELDALDFDRLNQRWQPVFQRAGWLLRGLFPDVRAGRAEGTGLLFNMEQLFERFIGLKVRRAWESPDTRRYEVRLQSPQRHLAPAERAFLLKPDITVLRDGKPLFILDTKWKQLGDGPLLSQVAPDDVYQMTTYAMRYGCSAVTLIYPSSGKVSGATATRLDVPGAPELRISLVDIDHLATGGDLPVELHPPSQMQLAAAS